MYVALPYCCGLCRLGPGVCGNSEAPCVVWVVPLNTCHRAVCCAAVLLQAHPCCTDHAYSTLPQCCLPRYYRYGTWRERYAVINESLCIRFARNYCYYMGCSLLLLLLWILPIAAASPCCCCCCCCCYYFCSAARFAVEAHCGRRVCDVGAESQQSSSVLVVVVFLSAKTLFCCCDLRHLVPGLYHQY